MVVRQAVLKNAIQLQVTKCVCVCALLVFIAVVVCVMSMFCFSVIPTSAAVLVYVLYRRLIV